MYSFFEDKTIFSKEIVHNKKLIINTEKVIFSKQHKPQRMILSAVRNVIFPN